MRLRLLGLVPLLLLGSQLAPAAQAAGPIVGSDVSMYQHPDGKPIDWAAVKRSGQTFAFIKATGGSRGYDRTDPWFAREWAAAGRAGIVRGAYHYADPSRDADAQAAYVVGVVGTTREANDLGIVLDLETTGGRSPASLSRWAHAFLEGVERRTGRVPILYSYPSFWHNAMRDDRSFGAYPLWLAHYTSKTPGPLPGWDRWTFWQSSSSSHVPGIPGRVDHDVMCCSAGTLAALADGRSVAITAAWRAYGGASGDLGLPLGPEAPTATGWSQTFERGFVATSPAGTWVVLGSIYDRYKDSGGPSGPLGLPVDAQQTLVGGVVLQRFEGGVLVGTPAAGLHLVRGDLMSRWLADGGPSSPEGLPIGEESAVSQQFVGGGLYRAPSGVRLVPGAIRDRYEELGGPSSSFGFPIDEAHPSLGGVAVDFEVGQLLQQTVAGQTVVV